MSFGDNVHAGKDPSGSVHTEQEKCSLEVDVLGPASCQRLVKHLHDNHRAVHMQTHFLDRGCFWVHRLQ